jgi:hypothetical protein
MHSQSTRGGQAFVWQAEGVADGGSDQAASCVPGVACAYRFHDSLPAGLVMVNCLRS